MYRSGKQCGCEQATAKGRSDGNSEGVDLSVTLVGIESKMPVTVTHSDQIPSKLDTMDRPDCPSQSGVALRQRLRIPRCRGWTQGAEVGFGIFDASRNGSGQGRSHVRSAEDSAPLAGGHVSLQNSSRRVEAEAHRPPAAATAAAEAGSGRSVGGWRHSPAGRATTGEIRKRSDSRTPARDAKERKNATSPEL